MRSMLCVLAVLTLALGTAATAANAAHSHHGIMLGSREAGGEGDEDGWGVAAATFNGNELFYYLLVRNIGPPTAAHIHIGDATTSGNVVISLSPSFESLGNDLYRAWGRVEVELPLASQIARDPWGYYFNVHTEAYPGGAIRAQLIAHARSNDVWAAYLGGNAEIGAAGDEDGAGYGIMADIEGSLYYYVLVLDADMPSAAHLHRGRYWEAGGVVLDFAPSFRQVDGSSAFVAVGMVPVDSAIGETLDAQPGRLYLNVHNSAFPAGAMRGQVQRPERWLYVPVVSRTTGLHGSNWVTTAFLSNQVRNDASARIGFYPSSMTGLSAPALIRTLEIPGESKVAIDDFVGEFLSSDGNGAISIVTQQPLTGWVRILNDQSDDPSLRGSFGQNLNAELMEESSLIHGGVLTGLSNLTAKHHQEARTNLGYFNPAPTPVTATFSAYRADGLPLGTTTLTIPGYSHRQDQVFDIISDVPEGDRNQTDFFVTYSFSDGGAFVYASVVDNGTNDGTTVPLLPTQ